MEKDLLERVNPVFNTAKMTVFQLAASGNEDAVKITEKMGLTFEETQNSANTTASEEQFLTNSTMLEIRYKTVKAIADKMNLNYIVDMPCGYTPRSLECASEGVNYIGLDLPAVVNEVEPIIKSMLDEDKKKFVSYYGIDATNGNSLKEALSGVNGPICITTEGILMYFTDSEVGEMCDNIRELLNEYGGCWINADLESSLQYMLIAKPVCGDRFMEVMKSSSEKVEDKSDVKIGKSKLIINPREDFEKGIKDAMVFLAAHGLTAERINVADYMPELDGFSKLTKEQADSIKENMSKCAYWKITVMENSYGFNAGMFEEGEIYDTNDLKDEEFDLSASYNEGSLYLKLIGRVDTLTAPHILTLYERVKGEHEISEVVVDCERLDYISSAGLRVLLIMKKGSPESLKLQNVNRTVEDVLEQTGFIAVFEIV